jgi:putative ABC transport system substrate-binding protein
LWGKEEMNTYFWNCSRKNLQSAIRNPKFLVLLSALLFALCVSAQAQQPTKVPRIGFQLDAPAATAAARIEAFRQGLRELGYIEGKNIIIEWRSSEGRIERRSEIAAEFVRLKVDVISSESAGRRTR